MCPYSISWGNGTCGIFSFSRRLLPPQIKTLYTRFSSVSDRAPAGRPDPSPDVGCYLFPFRGGSCCFLLIHTRREYPQVHTKTYIYTHTEEPLVQFNGSSELVVFVVLHSCGNKNASTPRNRTDLQCYKARLPLLWWWWTGRATEA